ncbi:nucleotide sugar dehydrogenase [Enterococcus wangshanyuanii]|uniref:UDP-N-acetyl-D-glucosamine dehydrogenase n=1 Tax=Enterococcus wangshanyuanii TaxID=2005703 RepID=A0ABQ1P4D0_9ENTE|nr:nucleotide sugar dehydrogenase [Enterococcus wangshanyuanii]GGC90835.1 UDP-N-acetyl-D-glucosamine dehydrogenase [Enterococcus wangshanyuanii]
MNEKLVKKINNREAKIGVIGLGYVGLPLAMAFVSAGFEVIGIDTNEKIVKSLNAGDSHILDVDKEVVASAVQQGKFVATTDFAYICKLDALSVCVPTPLNQNQEPDISFLEFTANKVEKYMKSGLLISVESTTYPGSTRELFYEKFEQGDKEIGKDYYLCFSPERVDPGNTKFQTKNIPKVLGGITAESSELGKILYGSIIEEVIIVSSPETAEMSKLLENTFRSINIAFINEMAMMCERMGIDIWESIDAAATKPFGFMPFYPGAGVGGHCIPLDPMYLYWKGKQNKFFNKFIELSQDINMNMPFNVLTKIQESLNGQGKSIKNARILIVGLSYKPNVGDIRESPSLDIYEKLKQKHAKIDILDPFVPSFRDSQGELISVMQENNCVYSIYDCVVILTKHDSIDYQLLLSESKAIVDMSRTYTMNEEKVFRIGGGSSNHHLCRKLRIKESKISGN